jgi:flagella basal body P-ring formation protein FlgA
MSAAGTTAAGTTSATTLNGRGSGAPGSSGFGRALPTRQRRPGLVALAVVLIVGLAAFGMYLYQRAGAKVPVLVMAREVPAGHVVERADLSTVSVAGAVTAVAASHIDSVVGETAAVDLLPNMLVQRSMLTHGSAIATGQVEVGVAIKPGQAPAEGLSPGNRVEVLQVPAKDATGPGNTPQVLSPSAVIFSVAGDPSTTGGTVLSLLVPQSVAPLVAAASANGQIALVQVPPQ